MNPNPRPSWPAGPRVLLSGLCLMATLACLMPTRKADFEADLRRWVGRSSAEFIQYKGNPEQIRPRAEGGKIYVFLTHKSPGVQMGVTKFARADGTLGPGVPMRSGPLFCRLILETDAAGTILTTRWEGNDCW